ncbi:MAG TPA: AAA family ATPase [Dehalococcoidia bacterium]|nr:AAA family ATPase [Dehalococcoidia bacterium]
MSAAEQPVVVILDADPVAREAMEGSALACGLNVGAMGTFGVESELLIRDGWPDAVLLGLEPPVERGLQTLRALAAAQPEIPVIVYSSQTDGAAVRRAMIAGARDVVAAPAAGQPLYNAVAGALRRTSTTRTRDEAGDEGNAISAQPGGKVIAVFGPKGGCGKTTLATNLAVDLAMVSHARVALVDLSARFGDVALTLDVPAQHTVADVVREIGSITYATIARYLTPHPSGLLVLPSSRDASEWDATTPETTRRVIGLLAQSFDYVVLDAPQAFTYTVAAAVDLATVALGVTSLDLTSVKDMTAVVSMLRDLNFPLAKLKLVMNHRGAVKGATAEELSRAIGIPVAFSIPHDKALQYGLQTGVPAVKQAPNAPASRAIREIVRSLIPDSDPLPERRRGLFGRLAGFRQVRSPEPLRRSA